MQYIQIIFKNKLLSARRTEHYMHQMLLTFLDRPVILCVGYPISVYKTELMETRNRVLLYFFCLSFLEMLIVPNTAGKCAKYDTFQGKLYERKVFLAKKLLTGFKSKH